MRFKIGCLLATNKDVTSNKLIVILDRSIRIFRILMQSNFGY